MHYIEEASGQGLVEYALLLVLVAVAIVFALAAFGRTVTNLFDQIYDSLAAIQACLNFKESSPGESPGFFWRGN